MGHYNCCKKKKKQNSLILIENLFICPAKPTEEKENDEKVSDLN
jgi:hypothetical protein